MSGDAVIRGLIQRGAAPHIAYGIAGNMQIESDGFKTDVNEYAPLVPGSRGGYGLNQWTGPRRRQFEQFASDRQANPADLDTQLDFTMWELENTEKRAGAALSQAQTTADAARIYSQQFLRPGIPHLERRIAAAERLAGGSYPAAQGEPSPQGAASGPQAPINNLAAQQPPERDPFKMQNTLQDPRAFMSQAPRNQLAAGGFSEVNNPFLSQLRGI